MSFIGATGFNSFQEELDNEIQNTSNYINTLVLGVSVNNNLTSRVSDLENTLGESADISNNILATGFHLAIDNLESNVGTPKTITSINEPTISTNNYVSLHQVDEEHKYILYKHDGSTNTSTSYSITFNENTTCDIFVLAGGGGGGGNSGGGGGAGGLSFLENATIPQGTYNIVVGNAGSGGSGNGNNGNNSSFLTNDATPLGIIAYGGGGGSSTSGGSTTTGSYTGTFTKSSINHFANNGVSAGGGGGAGAIGNSDDGGDGIKNISSIDFKTLFNITNNSTIGESNNNYLYFGGGGGTNSGDNGLGNQNSLNTITGGGGKGGGSGQNGDNGSQGLVIIRYKFSTISVNATGLNLEIHNLINEVGDAPTLTPLYIGTGMHREITLLEQGVGLPTSIQGAWMSHGNGLYGITDSIMTQLGMTDYAVAGNAADIFASQLTGTFATLFGWIAGTGSTITIAQAINKLDERIKPFEDDIKNNLQQGDVVVVIVNDRTDDMYFLNAGNVGIGYSKNTQLSAKLHVNGNFHCNDVNCDDIVCDKIGIGTSTNHTNTLLDVRGFASFGDSTSVIQAISLKSQSGLWNIQSDNSGNNGTNNNQLIISSLLTNNQGTLYDKEYLLIQNDTGNIGIGKTPAYKLDVDGNINCTGLRVNGNVFTAWTNVISGYLGDIKWNSGAVGVNIGNSSIPIGILLDARGNVSFGDGITTNQGIVIKSSLGYYSIGSDNSGGGTDSSGNFNGNQFYLYDNHNTSYIMTAQRTTGNVGIGNANRFSSYKLDVDGDINIKSGSKYKINGVNLSYANLDNLLFTSIDSSTLSNTGGVLSVIGGGGTSSQWTTSGNDIYYNSVGKVGIGGIPGHKFYVNGDCKIQGDEYITGNLGIGVASPNTKIEIDGALRLTGSSAGNPGNNSSASFWNQPGIGATISGYHLAVNTNGTTEALRIDHVGNIGIGFTQPNRKLDITDGTTITNSTASNTGTMIRCVGGLGTGKYNGGKAGIECAHSNGSAGIQIGYHGIGQSGNGTSYGVNIFGRGAQLCNIINNNGVSRFEMNDNGNLYITGTVNPSDIRIKENIRDIDDCEALNKILALQPKKYEYIDKQDRGDKSVIGFIAQQVREVIPEAIKISEELAPNVLKWCDYINGKLYINIPEITIGTKINFRTNEEKNEGDTLKVKEIFEDYILFDDEDGMMILPSEDIKKLFVFGYHLNDFHMVEKAMIFTMNVAATQELHKIIMEQKEEINLLKEILARNGIV